jgi:hypothetical protein
MNIFTAKRLEFYERKSTTTTTTTIAPLQHCRRNPRLM